MTLDPKKLEAAVSRYVNVTDLLDDQAQHIVTELLEAYGIPDLEARAARADELEVELADARNMAAFFLDTASGNGVEASDLRAEIAALKAEVARLTDAASKALDRGCEGWFASGDYPDPDDGEAGFWIQYDDFQKLKDTLHAPQTKEAEHEA